MLSFIRRSTILMPLLFVHGISSVVRSMYGSPIMRIQHPWDPDFGSETMILLISRRQTANPMWERFGTTIMIVSNSLILSGDYFTANNLEPVKYVLPEEPVKIGPDEKPTTFSLGWRIQPGKIECYFNDQKVITYTNVPMDLGMTRPSPILLVNHSCYIEFDNFIVATVDYNLFQRD